MTDKGLSLGRISKIRTSIGVANLLYFSLVKYGGCSSMAEHLIVVQAVAGSSPVIHPKKQKQIVKN